MGGSVQSARARFLRALVRGGVGRSVVAALLVAMVAAGGLLILRSAHASSILYVSTTGADGAGCGPSGSPCASISGALANAGTGDTILVGPGTYTLASQIIVNKSVMIKGAQAGVDARTRPATPSPSTESIIDGSALTSGTAYDFAIYAANVTIDGFVMENAADSAVYGPIADGLMFENNIIQDCNAGVIEFSGSGITMQQNVFQNLDVAAYSSYAVDGDAIYDDFQFDNLTVTQNIIRNSGQALTLIESTTMPTAHVSITHNQIDDPSFAWNTTGSFSYNTVTGNAAVVNTFGGPTIGLKLGGSDVDFTVDHNTFTGLQAYSVKTTADQYGAPYDFADDNTVSITNNTFTYDVAAITSNLYSAAMDIRNLQGSSTISGNTVDLSGSFTNGNATAAYAVQLQGADTQTLAISNNVLNGGGVGVGSSNTAPVTSGIAIVDSLSSTAAVSITGNMINGWVDGVNADTLDASATIAAHQNCIFSNSSYGAQNGSGASITADHNWWGAASGPHNASSNPSGTGNGASSNVSYAPFLTAPASICAGPVASALAVSPTPLNSMTGFTFTATLSDASTGQFNIASGQYNVDGGAYGAMSASDGTFDQVTEAVKVSLGALAAGNHVLCVRGTDAAGNQGAATCVTVNVVLAENGADVAGTTSSQTGAHNGSTSSQANGSSQQQPLQEQVPAVIQQPQHRVTAAASSSSTSTLDVATLAGILMMLIGIGGIGWVLYRARRHALV
jgi:hypothetical protein